MKSLSRIVAELRDYRRALVDDGVLSEEYTDDDTSAVGPEPLLQRLDEIIGDFGLVGGGAAGLELDRAEHDLGTPPNLVVLARSENHTDLILLVNEESAVTTPDMTGSQNDMIRADLAFFETPAGGAVFSTGSIAWCGSLSHGGYDNNVSRITRNVLNRFLEHERFAT